MAKERILIIEDDEHIQELVRYNLEKDGYEVTQALSGEEGVRLAEKEIPSLILLDLMLPGIDGLEVCRRLRNNSRTSGLAIIMLTAKSEDIDEVTGLEMGADDYMAKPFSPRVLLARVKAVIRRQDHRKEAPSQDQAIIMEDLQIHPGRHEVIANGQSLNLTAYEFKILHLLARRPGWVFTRYQIVDLIHGEGYPVTDRSVDVQIAGLRKKMGEAGNRIETVRGVGYRMKEG